MSLIQGYLTDKQKLIWDLKSKGFTEAGIARKLKVSRQTVHKALDIANSKVSTALEEAAKINKIKIKILDPPNGVLLGYSSYFKTEALIIFSAKNGVQVWYKHEGECNNCDQVQSCREALLTEAKERNIPLPENANSMPPSKLAEILFSKIIGE
jgi:hypothetical protein